MGLHGALRTDDAGPSSGTCSPVTGVEAEVCRGDVPFALHLGSGRGLSLWDSSWWGLWPGLGSPHSVVRVGGLPSRGLRLGAKWAQGFLLGG